MVQSAEFEAAIMARRVEIQALCAEARRVEGEGEAVWDLGITIPAGWLPMLAEGLDRVVSDDWEDDESDERVARAFSDASSEEADELERLRSLGRAIREVDAGSSYTISARHGEALWRGFAVALFIQEYQLIKMSKHFDPQILRFVAIEQGEALASFCSALHDLLDDEEG